MVRHMTGKSPYNMFFKEHPKYRNHLRSIGEIAVVANHERKSTMFVGYAEDHMVMSTDSSTY